MAATGQGLHRRLGRSLRPVNSHVEGEQETPGLHPVALLAFGVLAGIYLLYSVAWLITVLRNPTQIADPFANFMFLLGLWLAMLFPASWFGATLWLGRERSPWLRIVILTVGVFVLIPWPYIVWAS